MPRWGRRQPSPAMKHQRPPQPRHGTGERCANQSSPSLTIPLPKPAPGNNSYESPHRVCLLHESHHAHQHGTAGAMPLWYLGTSQRRYAAVKCLLVLEPCSFFIPSIMENTNAAPTRQHVRCEAPHNLRTSKQCPRPRAPQMVWRGATAPPLQTPSPFFNQTYHRPLLCPVSSAGGRFSRISHGGVDGYRGSTADSSQPSPPQPSQSPESAPTVLLFRAPFRQPTGKRRWYSLQ